MDQLRRQEDGSARETCTSILWCRLRHVEPASRLVDTTLTTQSRAPVSSLCSLLVSLSHPPPRRDTDALCRPSAASWPSPSGSLTITHRHTTSASPQTCVVRVSSSRYLTQIPFTFADVPPEIFHLPLSLPSLLILPASIALPLLYIPLGRPWVLSNLLALCLSTATLALLRLDSFLTAGVLLGVLLVYDIFWVRVGVSPPG
jgi:hypothetical protein